MYVHTRQTSGNPYSPTLWHLANRRKIAPRSVLSPSTILTPPSSHCPIFPVRKSLESAKRKYYYNSFTKILLQFLYLVKLRNFKEHKLGREYFVTLKLSGQFNFGPHLFSIVHYFKYISYMTLPIFSKIVHCKNHIVSALY